MLESKYFLRLIPYQNSNILAQVDFFTTEPKIHVYNYGRLQVNAKLSHMQKIFQNPAKNGPREKIFFSKHAR